jgi:protein TonB
MRWLMLFYAFTISSAVDAKGNILTKAVTNITFQTVTPPQFPGGEKAFYTFLGKNLKWPDSSIDAQGKVLVSFYIEKDGQLTNFKIERSLGALFDNEAIRVLKKSPKWIPAKQNGRPIRYKYTVPVNFTISE